MMAPCGKPTKANRFGVEPAAVWAHAVAAGFIASSSGSAMLAPTPFSTVRRETCFLNTYMSYLRYPLTASALTARPGLYAYAYCAAAVDVSAAAACGTRRILNCSLRTTAWTSAENR